LAYYRNLINTLFPPVFVFAILPLILHFSIRHQWQHAAEVREPRTYEFTSTGITMRGSTFQGSNSWTNVAQARSTGPLIILSTPQKLAYLIPRDSFNNVAATETFVQLVQAHIRDYRHL